MADNQPLLSVPDSSLPPSGTNTPPHRVPTPLKNTKHHLRPFVQAIMAFKNGHSFETKPSAQRTRRLSQAVVEEGHFAAALTVSQYYKHHELRPNYYRLSMSVSRQYLMTEVKPL